MTHPGQLYAHVSQARVAPPTAAERAWLAGLQSARHPVDAEGRRHERRDAPHTPRGPQALARFAEERADAFAAPLGVPLATVEAIPGRTGDPLVRAQAVGRLIAAAERGVDLRPRSAPRLPDALEVAGETGAVPGNLVANTRPTGAPRGGRAPVRPGELRMAGPQTTPGPVGLRDDPFTGVRVEAGTLTLPAGPGIGAATLHPTPITWDKD
ncbi:hypothetical protein HHL19_34055 [Streptomyces sp. R302]|uniref:hypothetical protein n=1 Tax=unclassified Streptomyces TaxID=2593676 RepID=UPI00145D3013|nr:MULTISPECIES: hypothetical protein [unclassified Streptomyces]NML54849.1 hypothetical protein [Streptomyces sp. R301]NML83536.1 hypothetical protein [Streptomyces sp. R302]